MKKITRLFLVLITIFSISGYSAFADSKISTYNYNDAKPLIESHDVISVDIFDTLLVRPYAEPGDMLKHLRTLQSKCGFTKEQPNGKGSELEKIILQPHTENVELFNYAKSLGKRIIIVSDMYLHEDFLAKMLRKNGIDGWSKLYVSSDYKAKKSTGKLFDIVLNDLNVKPNTILHIGDNKKSDCEMAKSKGIDCFYTPKLIDRLFIQEPRLKKYYEENKDTLMASIFVGLASLNVLKHNNNYWYNLGYLYSGPVNYAFAKWLQDEFKKDGIEEALFVSRDGYTPHKVFNLIKDRDCNVNTNYAYVPRGVSVLTTLDLKLSRDLGINYLFNYYRNKDEFLKINTPQNTNNIEEYSKFLNDNIEIYRKLAQKEKEEYKKYLDTMNLDNKKIAYVDCGSSYGTGLKLLSQYLNIDNVTAYFAYTSHLQGYNKKVFSKVFTQVKFQEFMMTAPEPTALRVKNNSPVYGEEKEELLEIQKQITQGAIDFAKDAEKSLHGLNLFTSPEYLRRFGLILDLPATEQKDIDMLPIFKSLGLKCMGLS